MVRRYGLYARRSKSLSLDILKGSKIFIQRSLAFVRDLPKALSWRERLIKSFGKDPLICPDCHQEMELWRIWNPGYGNIYDFGRDSPPIEYEETVSEKEKTKEFMGFPLRFRQLCLLGV